MARAYVAIGITTLLWAINFKVGKIGTSEIDPLFIASFRIIVTGLFFYGLLSREDRKLRPTDWKPSGAVHLFDSLGGRTARLLYFLVSLDVGDAPRGRPPFSNGPCVCF